MADASAIGQHYRIRVRLSRESVANIESQSKLANDRS